MRQCVPQWTHHWQQSPNRNNIECSLTQQGQLQITKINNFHQDGVNIVEVSPVAQGHNVQHQTKLVFIVKRQVILREYV